MVIDLKTAAGTSHKSVPLELKTGKASFNSSHLGQTMLYSLMLNENKYIAEKISQSVLFYLKTGESRIVAPKHKEIRDMVIARNNLESFMLHKPSLLTKKDADDFEKICSSVPPSPDPINR